MSKIMLVEDDNNLREIYGARLEAEGYDIVSAKDGEEALALAVQEKPDLIISDVMMPRISGFDMLDILRNAPETKDTKVIMMTALSQAEDKSRADKLGADRYLVKSQVTLEDVANVVHEVLEGAPAASSEAPSQTTPPVVSETVDEIANPVVEVHDEPSPSQVQAPPTEQAAPARQPFQLQQESPQPEPTPSPAPTAPQPTSPDVKTTPAASAPPVQQPAQASDLPPIVQPSAASTIQVDLPQAAAPAPQSIPVTSGDDEQPSDFVGPNLAEALASEGASDASPTQSLTEAPTINIPTVSNGTPPVTVVEPQQQPTVIQPTAPAPAEPAPEQPSEVITNNNVAGMRVIQPINDVSPGPNINELLANEERKAAVQNPTANTVITPETTNTNQQNTEVKQPPKDDHFNNISL